MAKSSVSGVNPGIVHPFAGASVPAGFLLCDGSAVSRTTYARLFAMIGIAHGQGDGTTTFNLPDYRGRFLRGVDGTAARDPDKAARTAAAAGGNTGDAVGSVQDDAMQRITGSVGGTWRNSTTTAGTGAFSKVSTGAIGANGSDAGAGLSFDSADSVGARTSTETRGKNANVNYIISY